MASELADKIFSPITLAFAIILVLCTVAMFIVIPIFSTISISDAEDVMNPLINEMNKEVMEALNKIN